MYYTRQAALAEAVSAAATGLAGIILEVGEYGRDSLDRKHFFSSKFSQSEK